MCKSLRSGRTASIRIALRSMQNGYLVFAVGESAQRAIPKIQVTFPVFQIALGRYDHGELLSGFALERRQPQRSRRTGHQPADRNDARAALDFVEHTAKFSALNN